jgi:PAS domain-containing protein
MRHGPTCVVVATFQEARHFTAHTAHRYRELAERTGFVAAFGEGLDAEPVRGVRGAVLRPDDVVRGEWDIVVVSPHFAAALLARDLGDTGADADRTFEFALTYDRDTCVRAAQALLGRVVPQLRAVTTTEGRTVRPEGHAVAPSAPAGGPVTSSGVGPADVLLRRALAATTSGITIADVTLPDAPLVYVNTAFERLSGVRAEQVLGRNCRFMQSDDTDPAALQRIRDAIAQGREHTETLPQRPRPDRTPVERGAPGTGLRRRRSAAAVHRRADRRDRARRRRARPGPRAQPRAALRRSGGAAGLPRPPDRPANRRRSALVLGELLAHASGGAGAVLSRRPGRLQGRQRLARPRGR